MLFFVIPSFFDNMLENSFDLCLLGDWGVMSMCFFFTKYHPDSDALFWGGPEPSYFRTYPHIIDVSYTRLYTGGGLGLPLIGLLISLVIVCWGRHSHQYVGG